MKEVVKIKTLELFPVLDSMLIGLLESLTEAEWNTPLLPGSGK